MKTLLAGTRLLTLTGPGGTGKTRLALRVADEVAGDFPDGTFFVDLAPVSEPGLVISAIAAALGVREEGWERPVRDAVEDYLRDRRLLLVLDNFEQVLDAATQVPELLARTPSLKIVVTSRAALRVRGEQVVPIPPLEVPVPGEGLGLQNVSHIEAVTLFTQRASAVAPHFALTEHNAPHVAELVARFGWASARHRVGRVQGRRPDSTGHARADGPPAAAVDDGSARPARPAADAPGDDRMELRAARTGRTQAHAAPVDPGWRVHGGNGRRGVRTRFAELETDVLQLLTVLAENSLAYTYGANHEDLRFAMLQTIREFGLERLEAEDDRRTIERRHAETFLRLAEDAEPDLRGPQLAQWLIALQDEHENLRAAIRSGHRG